MSNKLSPISLFSTAVSSARAGSMLQSAIAIFVDQISTPQDMKLTHRQRCVQQFEANLNMKPATASTYYDLASKAFLQSAEAQNQQVIAGNPVRIYTAFRVKPGTDKIVARVVLPKQSDATAVASGFGMTVVKGIVDIGSTAPQQ